MLVKQCDNDERYSSPRYLDRLGIKFNSAFKYPEVCGIIFLYEI